MENRNSTNTSDVGYQSDIPNPHRHLSSTNLKSSEKNDDLIGSLAERYENRRAQQVGEWERLYKLNVYRAV